MQSPPGRTSTQRTALVVTADGEVAVALRERLDRAYVTVREVHPEEVGPALDSCLPWPWLLVGAVADPGEAVLALIRTTPTVVLWYGAAPEGLPAHVRAFTRFADLAAAAERAIGAEVGGLRLAIGSGVSHPSGAHSESAELQALISLHPAAFRLSPRRFSAAGRVLSQWRSEWRPGRTASGGVALQAGGCGSPLLRTAPPPSDHTG